MIRVGSLIWSLLVSLIVTALSFFYTQGDKGGYPLSFTYLDTEGTKQFSLNVFIGDVLLWWLLFSIFLVVIKNSLFNSYQGPPKKQKDLHEDLREESGSKEIS